MTLTGARTPSGVLYSLQMALNYLRLGRWMREHGFEFTERLPRRGALYDFIAERIRDRKVLYLEFGVHRGWSMRYWSEALRHPEAMLHGFDSFVGLPEDFDAPGGYPKGHFSTGGAAPEIADSRVTFHVGWFEETLPSYELPEHEILVVNLDADLYSSTIYVLRHLRDEIHPGTLLFLDDMSRPDHEPKAFAEFMDESGLRFRPVAADRSLNHACFECVGEGQAESRGI
ncbi:MAG: class I SAM-dependent methyltransferase [Actinobacteria bacterium]|nr:MAG: class I SAM-dependent methyltransferase [Actinomycetota bacterium]